MHCDSFLPFERAHKLLEHYGDGAPWMKHCVAVSSLATFLSGIFALKYPVHVEFIRTASLLHDIGRWRTHDPIMHGVEGYKLLSGLGHANEASICVSHIAYGLSSSEALHYGLPECEFIPQSFEEMLIPLVDFLVEHDRPVSLKRRFASLRERNRDNPFFISKLDQAERKAQALMIQLNNDFAISMEELACDFFRRNCRSHK